MEFGPNIRQESISQDSRMNSQLASEKMKKQLKAVRSKKIKRLKAQISSGSYRVDNLRVAKALFLSQ